MRFLDKIKYNRSYFLFLFIMILFNTFYLQKAMSGVVQNNIILLLVLLLIMVVEIIISYLIYHFNLNKKYPIEKLFLLFFVPLGFLYMIVLPMAGTPDEAVHFYRAYEVSMGHVTSVSKGELNGRQMPKSLLELFKNTQRFDQIKYKDTLKSFQIQLNKEKKQFIIYANI